MPKSNTYSFEVINNVFLDDTPVTFGGELYISLHTANPVGGNQLTSEATYTNYARQFVDRSSAGWNLSQNGSGNWRVNNQTDIVFPAAGSGPQTITHVGVGTAASGAGVLLYIGTIADGDVDVGVTPKILSGQLTITEE
jgi:hypothetical protein